MQKIACDIDGVLMDFHNPFLRFVAERYGVEAGHDDFENHSGKLWKDNEEYDTRLQAFYDSEHSRPELFEGAQEYLHKLAREGWWMEAITSRPSYMRQRTLEELEKHFPKAFKAVDFSVNKDGRRKLDLCKQRELKVLIEDIPRYAAECSEAGMVVLLFDRPWNKQFDEKPHNITRVHSWKEIHELLQKI